MALVGALPTRAWVETFTTAHLRDLAVDFPRTADLWERSFTDLAAHMQRPGGTEWTGPAAVAAQDSTDKAGFTARGAAGHLRDAAGIAAFAADQLDGLHSKTLNAIAEARSDGFQVDERLSVTDTRRHPWGSNAYAARQTAAEEHAETIQSYAGQLLGLDNHYAAKLDAATAGLDALTLDVPGGDTPPANAHNGTQLLSGHSFKQAPADGAEPPPPPRVEGLPPDGVRPPVSGDLTPGTPSRPSQQARGGQSLWDEKGGEWRYFPGDKHHNPHWDYNPHDTKFGKWQNIPIGDLPHLKEPPTAPFIGAPPGLPPSTGQAPVGIPPAVVDHPPGAVPPAVQPTPALPPWLQDPSPPGFQLTPTEPPPIAAWDVPDAPPAASMPPPEGPPITLPSLPAPPPEAVAGAGGLAAVGAAILAGLGWLAHPFGR